MTRFERYAPLATGILFAIPSVVAHYPPMSDLPLHEGVVGLLRHYGDPAYFPPDLYELNLGQTNQLFYFVALALSYLVGTTWAVKLVVAACQIALLVVAGRLSDHLGRSRWAAVLFAPLALGFTYYWGLVTNLTGFVAFFAALPFLDRASVAPTARSLAKVIGVLLVIFFAHESSFVLAVGFTGVLAVARPFDRRLTRLRVVPLVFGMVFMVAYFFWSTRFLTGGQLTPPAYFPPIWDKVVLFSSDLFGSHDALARNLLLLLGVTAIVSLLVARIRSKEPGYEEHVDTTATGWRGRLLRVQAMILHYRFEALGVVFLVAVILVPMTFHGATLLHARFVGPAWALFAVTAAPRIEPPRLAKLAAVCLPLGMALLSWPQFVDSNRTYRDLDALIEQIPLNSSVALAALDPTGYHTRVYSAGTGPARTVALRGGRMAVSLIFSPLSPVQLRKEYRWDEMDQRMVLSGSRGLMPAHDLTRFSWIIAQSRDPNIRDLLVVAFMPDAELVAKRGEWLLFRSTRPQRPLTIPDDPPHRAYQTILDRVHSLVEREKKRAREAAGDDGPPPPPATAP